MFGEVYLVLLLCLFVGGGVVPQDNSDDGPLNLTPFLINGEIEKAKKLSAVDPSLFAGVKSHAAYFTVNDTLKWNTFFWYFPVEKASVEDTPLIIWLQGGPGSSSLYGLFNEIGPIQINNITNEVERMPITWGSDYSLLFIDNPVGTGFSYTESGEYASNEEEVGLSLLKFLQQFLQVFTEASKSPLFITGESYAGKYIPAFGYYILKHQFDSLPINLKGLAIGDGWTDPPTLLHYSELALQVGLVDPEQAAKMHEYEESARKYWEAQNFYDYSHAAGVSLSLLNRYALVNVYNYVDDNVLSWEPLENLMNRKEVQSALHVKKMNYKALSKDVFEAMSIKDFYDTVKPWLEEVLEHYGVMGYSGQLDLIVGYALSVNTYRSLKWSGAEEYLKAERKPLFDEDMIHVNAYVKASGNFMDVMVRGAGHMVPADKPRAAKQIIDMFINKFK